MVKKNIGELEFIPIVDNNGQHHFYSLRFCNIYVSITNTPN